MHNLLKQRINDGEKVIGAFIGIYSPSIIEMLGYAGYDFVVIDDEHGAFSYSELENLIRTADSVGITPIVRVSYDESSIQKALDRGAKGIQVPMVNTPEDAKEVVRKATFPPIGTRGAAYSHRAARYGKDSGEDFLESSNDSILIIVHIETPEAVRNFEEIINISGIDIAFIGSTDLSVNMGYKNGPNNAEVQDTIRILFEKGEKANTLMGTVAGDSEGACKALAQGANFVGIVSSNMISNVFSNSLNMVRKHIKSVTYR
ncbi:HpcH/HpaI aldolase/citrate lyase family protein [Priestia megaterium]|uniref:HpcH/HpaI aldolase family protein n=1 Tax=Priestia megaterium TaxID=1404 RepID=UPI003670B100